MFTTTSIYLAFVLYDTLSIERATMSAVGEVNRAVTVLEECMEQKSPCLKPRRLRFLFANSDVIRLAAHDIPLEYCVGTAALTTNIIIGDAIVLGRAYVLYPKNRIIRLALLLLLLGTLSTSIVSTAHSCQSPGLSQEFVLPDAETTGVYNLAGPSAGNLMGSFFEGDIFGIAASVISLATNVISTCLVGYRAWQHRALVRGNGLGSFSDRSRVSRAMALLIESGAFYSAIWIVVVVYQFITRPFFDAGSDLMNDGKDGHHSSIFRTFTAGWEGFTEGGLVVVIAIYPTIIMLLVALNRSECDTIASYRGSGQDATVPGSLVFRGSAHHAQTVDFPGGDGGSVPHAAASVFLSSVVDLETADCSFEKEEGLAL
ncbi:hypothetical protein GSI_03496 [Ganoderma sinense ZZ0214-1]|uniref:Uncharacterized protein n=1 Tax=Ganoderma sinense ZZ0214-1 TaxID=1077348 RepID=A0A2G8SLR7_9APHY|nr:hypothetical protein GSI_03496 [Ganoderma sinense ZZ0214-1]